MAAPHSPDKGVADATFRALGDELNYLRKGAGFTATRITKTPVLRHLLGGKHEPFDGLRERLESAITSLHDPEPELLLTVFALTPDSAPEFVNLFETCFWLCFRFSWLPPVRAC